MFTRFRISLLIGSLIIFTASSALRFLRLRGYDRPVPAWAKEPSNSYVIREYTKRRKTQLYSELIRLGFDFCICLFILLSGVYSSWFRLFPGSLAGFSAGFSFLISFTLLASVAVDWLQLRILGGSRSMEPQDKLRFFNQEILSILLIEIGINIVLVCIWSLKKIRAGVLLIVIVSFLALLIYRMILFLLKNTKRHFQELPESELKTRLITLLARNGYRIQRVLVRAGGNASASYGVDLHRLRRQSLVLDRSLICTLTEEEIYSVVMYHLEMKRQKLWPREWMFRGAQGAAIVVSASILLAYIKSYSRLGDIALSGMQDLLHLSVPFIGCFAVTVFLQSWRNLKMNRMMMNADQAVISKGYGQYLRNALIQTSEMETLNPEPTYELLINKPEFLPCRIEKIDQALRRKKGESSDEQT